MRFYPDLGTDLFLFNGHQYLITVDYYSSFFEVDKLHKTDPATLIEKLKRQFSRHGISEIVISDNGWQFAFIEFARFASGWHFQHITSCPLHSQSNGKGEIVLKICKDIMRKAIPDILNHISHYSNPASIFYTIVVPPRKLVHLLLRGRSARGHAICYWCQVNN